MLYQIVSMVHVVLLKLSSRGGHVAKACSKATA